MASYRTLFVIFAIFSLLPVVYPYEIQDHSHRLLRSEFSIDIVKNFLQCKSLCERRSLCKSVIYNPRTRECTSNFREVSKTRSIPNIPIPKKKSTSQSSGVCDKRPCEHSQICAVMGYQRVCLEEEISCGEPPDIPNARKLNNGTTLYSVITYRCNIGYAIANGTTTSSCEVTRRWTPTNLTCVEIDCGEPPDVPDAEKSTKSTKVDSVTIYTCKHYKEYKARSKCAETGKWTQIKLKCWPSPETGRR
ncbi:sushi, von Willebrand factor type A, EGF and pentraxin domain-containing protein 1-like [Gigantopelta aegis]|uniref:sushi, von Willebrand factor type A, EGF and pentraxin domain-containing protein 1-like n=1 Tax=Gigantopelta aegis TaxID=1735272 RepID=UPI001B88C1D5|nr:sushi, von Willebrand factor type A, EGF and pentraxin domain-containing protein 1-like [Gigantopelta aegis]